MRSFLLLLALLIPVTSVFPAPAPLPAATHASAPGQRDAPATPPGSSQVPVTPSPAGSATPDGPATSPGAGSALGTPAPGSAPSGPGPGPPGAGDPAGFTWPLAAPHPVVRPFVPPATPYGPGHRGVDLAGEPGTPVTAAGDGVVFHAGPLAGRGVVSIIHANGLRTTYEPVTAAVVTGARVTRGQVIGHLAGGHSGCVAAACLHWGALRGDEYLDPLALLTSGRVRLLPWKEG